MTGLNLVDMFLTIVVIVLIVLEKILFLQMVYSLVLSLVLRMEHRALL